MNTSRTRMMVVPAILGIFVLSSCISCTPKNLQPDTTTPDEPVDTTETPVPGPEEPALYLPDMVEIPAGSFMMGTQGASGQDYDEAPAHKVNLSAFRMSATEITNLQYESFDPSHKAVREGRADKISFKDDMAVIDVTWYDAVAYCKWLSEKTGKNYRLPTEAEWEYACRAGTTTPYSTGNSLPAEILREQATNRTHKWVSTEVGKTTPNAFGLYDMHGNVEEWCLDWYGPYLAAEQTNPVCDAGVFKVTRGGSHNTPVKYLRSANRSAATPDDSHDQIGFRVVESDTEPIGFAFGLPPAGTVSQEKYSWSEPSEEPFFLEPIPFVTAPTDGTPFYSHNHQPAVTWCDNGDLLAIWFTTVEENGREMEVLCSRLHPGAASWEPATAFFKVPDRNMTGSSLCHLPDGTLLHMNGVGDSGDWQNLALAMRKSSDNGETWTAPVLVDSRHCVRHQVIAGTIVLSDGTIAQCCDATPEGSGGTAIYLSTDGGNTWEDQWNGQDHFFNLTDPGYNIAGIHAGLVELKDGSLMAVGRGLNIAYSKKTPFSVSTDKGKTWTYSLTDWPLIGSGQRQVFLRLQEGPLMLATFMEGGMTIFLSEDEGMTWSDGKLLTDGVERTLDGGAFTGTFTMDSTHAEPKGYFCGTQTPDGTIHLLSSRIHYRFNLAWLKK